jgi:flagellar basal-body rod protein FlgB
MFLDRILNEGPAPLVERMVRFTSARHEVLAENIVNATTPGYRQKDLSLPAFQKALSKRIEERSKHGPGMTGFDDIAGQARDPKGGILFHDRNNRSMESLMSDFASNALKHNLYTEMMRKQFSTVEMILKDRVA